MINLGDIMENARSMKQEMQQLKTSMSRMKGELANEKLTTGAGKGAVLVTINGNMEITEIKIDPTAAHVNDTAKLSELIKAAVNEAVEKMKTTAASKVSSILGTPDPNAFKDLAGL